MGKRVDILGKRIGRLTVIAPAPTVDRRAYWKVRCDCGKEFATRSDWLLKGDKKSCGCARHDHLFGFRPLKVPAKGSCHPFVRALWQRMNYEHATPETIGKRAGVHEQTMRNWRTRRSPKLEELEAVINALGGRLLIRWDAE